ncbi:hypothetical protein ACFPYM_01925 [Methylobacterium hispanicum]
MKKLALSTLATAVAGSLLLSSAAEARPGYRGGGYYGGHGGYARQGGYGGYRHYGHRRGGKIGGDLAAGAFLGILGGAIAASQAPSYGYGYAPSYGYGYAPAYGYGYPAYGY